MPKRPSRAPTSGGHTKNSKKQTDSDGAPPAAELAKPKHAEPPLAYIPCRTPGCEWEAGHPHPCGKKLSGGRRPMTDAEELLLAACLSGAGDFRDAVGMLLIERLELRCPELGEALIVARVAELDATARRSTAWDQLLSGIGGNEVARNFPRALTPILDKIYQEADRRVAARDAQQEQRMDAIRTPPHAAEFRETQAAIAARDERATAAREGFGPFANPMEDAFRREELRQRRGDLGGPIFTEAEIAAQDALELAKQTGTQQPPAETQPATRW